MSQRFLTLLSLGVAALSVAAEHPADSGESHFYRVSKGGFSLLGPDTPEGFVVGLTGASSFGLTDGDPDGATCPECDSSIVFTTYSNQDRSDWTVDLGVTPTFLSGVDTTARWVFLYCVFNTDPQPTGEANIVRFAVASTRTNGDPGGSGLLSSGGFIDSGDMIPEPGVGGAPVPALDVPNDGSPSEIAAKSLLLNTNDDPDATTLTLSTAISSPGVRAGTVSYAGAVFDYSGIAFFSDPLFLTSNADFAGFTWAETEAAGAPGAAGDVPGPIDEALFSDGFESGDP